MNPEEFAHAATYVTYLAATSDGRIERALIDATSRTLESYGRKGEIEGCGWGGALGAAIHDTLRDCRERGWLKLGARDLASRVNHEMIGGIWASREGWLAPAHPLHVRYERGVSGARARGLVVTGQKRPRMDGRKSRRPLAGRHGGSAP
jgi:hypothetical protein